MTIMQVNKNANNTHFVRLFETSTTWPKLSRTASSYRCRNPRNSSRSVVLVMTGFARESIQVSTNMHAKGVQLHELRTKKLYRNAHINSLLIRHRGNWQPVLRFQQYKISHKYVSTVGLMKSNAR